MHKILVLWDRAIVVVIMGTMPIGVQGSRQIRLGTRHKSESHLQCQQQCNYPSKAESSSCYVNHATMEEAQAAPDIIIGMILVNDNNAIMLFESGASHSFGDENFVQKHNLHLSVLKNPMIVSSLGERYAWKTCWS
jgi:hypothetical protein